MQSVLNLSQGNALAVLVQTEIAAQPLQLDRCFQHEVQQRNPHEREGEKNGSPHLLRGERGKYASPTIQWQARYIVVCNHSIAN